VNGEVAGKMRDAAGQIRDTEIVVRLRPEDRDRLEDVLSVPLTTPLGAQVSLSAVTQIVAGTSPSQINRGDRQRETSVAGSLSGERSLGEVSESVRQALADMPLPPGAAIRIAGQTEQMEDSFAALYLSLALAVAFIYMVLASQFGSFVHPFTIMLALPLSIVGAFLALLLSRNPLDMMGMIGVILLMGLVTKNSILLVDYTIRLRSEGKDRLTALSTAAPVRLRPILMTTLAMIFGMAPTAFGLGAGAELRAPMAITVIGGLITSTALTLVVVPVAYTLVDDLGAVWRRARYRAGPSAQPAPGRALVPVVAGPRAVNADPAGVRADFESGSPDGRNGHDGRAPANDTPLAALPSRMDGGD
jgi:HAE1 family hydrophobic/amphiphilic exporter-1